MGRRIIKLNAKSFARIGAALVLGVSFSGLLPVVVSADQDYHNLPDGFVTNVQPMTLPSDLQSIATGKRITYVSTDVYNNKFLVTGAVITPNNEGPDTNIVAWAHGTTGVDSHCAPSANLDVFWPEAIAATKSYLQKGWAVAATDYQGLGGTGQHEYLVGNTEARSVIDSVRAARRLDNNLTSKYVVSGHSEGGQAALFAGEIANTYGQGLQLMGAVALAPVSNLHELLPLVPGTEFNGYMAFIMYGLNAYDPSVNVNTLLAQPAINLYPTVHTGCWGEVLTAYQDLTADQLVVNGQLPSSIIDEIAAYGDPAQHPSTVPVLLVQGTDDPLVLLTPTLQSEECANGVRSSAQYYDGVDHDNIPIVSTGAVGDWITGRFAGQTAPSDC